MRAPVLRGKSFIKTASKARGSTSTLQRPVVRMLCTLQNRCRPWQRTKQNKHFLSLATAIHSTALCYHAVHIIRSDRPCHQACVRSSLALSSCWSGQAISSNKLTCLTLPTYLHARGFSKKSHFPCRITGAQTSQSATVASRDAEGLPEQ